MLVRHAEKLGGSDPGLTDAGRARAEALAAVLADAGVDHLVASQFRRTTDTAAPLAARLGLEVETRPLDLDDAPASSVEIVRELAASRPGRTVVVVGHSNTVPAMAQALTGVALDDLDEADYDNLFVVLYDGDRGRLIRSRYGAPDPIP